MAEHIKNYINNLSKKLQENNKLEYILEEFKNQHKILPRIGVEIEFYLSSNIDKNKFSDLIEMPIMDEKGKMQYEINLSPSTSIINLIKQIDFIKEKLIKIANQLEGKVFLTAKPFSNDYGNGLHFHVDFVDKSSHATVPFDLDLASVSICDHMLETLLVFMPNAEDYLRIDKNFMSPTNICYGGNNRTVAIRIPDSLPKRLEHRVASPECDIYLSIYAILKSILLGFTPNNTTNRPINKIYGNAYDPQYNLESLPKSILEAAKYFNEKFFI